MHLPNITFSDRGGSVTADNNPEDRTSTVSVARGNATNSFTLTEQQTMLFATWLQHQCGATTEFPAAEIELAGPFASFVYRNQAGAYSYWRGIPLGVVYGPATEVGVDGDGPDWRLRCWIDGEELAFRISGIRDWEVGT